MDGLKINDLLKVYEAEIRKNVKHKKKLIKFERNKFSRIIAIYERLQTGNYHIKNYSIFLIYEPKCRIIMSLNMEDKIINHYVTRYILMPKLEKYLDYRNVATRKNMGSDYAIRLAKKYLEEMKKNDEFYVLKLDISKYFYSIDHEVLKSFLKKDLTDKEYEIINNIIDSTNENYINETITSFKRDDLPYYVKGKGLPIGNMTSQFLSIFYLSFLDHYIIHDLHLTKMIRYMDDYIIFHKDKEYLKECLSKIIEKLDKKFKLKCNPKKTKIVKASQGFVFLGYHFKIVKKKTIVKIRSETRKKIYKTIKRCYKNYEEDNFMYFYSVMNNYCYSFKYDKQNKLKERIESVYKS